MKSENIIFLLGAGASAEAKIPMSAKMVRDIDLLTEKDDNWIPFKELYNFLRSSIIYSKGILGLRDYFFNVEDLLVVIEELEKREYNKMYAFIGSWNTRLLDVAGRDFTKLSEFKKLIRDQLLSWMHPENGYEEDASYYSGFNALQTHFAQPLRVFTLNYDLCFENIVGNNNADIQLGFQARKWSYRNFEEQSQPPNFYLYKLHGSINWERKGNEILLRDHPIPNAELIFGLANKLTSIDPYYFFTSEFRKYLFSNETKLLIIIGYSYADIYLNEFIRQAIQSNPDLSILNVGYAKSAEDETTKAEKENLLQLLNIEEARIHFEYKGASWFLQHCMNESYLEEKVVREDLPF